MACAQRPAAVKAIAKAGHEIVAHACAQDVLPAAFSAEEVAADIAKTTEVVTAVAGARPVGWISPRGTPARESARALLAAGYQWHGDAFDEGRPHAMRYCRKLR